MTGCVSLHVSGSPGYTSVVIFEVKHVCVYSRKKEREEDEDIKQSTLTEEMLYLIKNFSYSLVCGEISCVNGRNSPAYHGCSLSLGGVRLWR